MDFRTILSVGQIVQIEGSEHDGEYGQIRQVHEWGITVLLLDSTVLNIDLTDDEPRENTRVH